MMFYFLLLVFCITESNKSVKGSSREKSKDIIKGTYKKIQSSTFNYIFINYYCYYYYLQNTGTDKNNTYYICLHIQRQNTSQSRV